MTEFETEGVLSIFLDQQSLQQARDEVENTIGSVSVGVEGGRATARSDGGTASVMDSDLPALAEDRNDLLEEILDELETGGGGGALVGGGGGGGGTGLLPIPSGSASARGSGGLLTSALTALALGDFGTSQGDEPAMQGSGAEWFGKTLNDIFGLSDSASDNPPIDTIFPDGAGRSPGKKTLAPGAGTESSLLSGDTTIEDLRQESEEMRKQREEAPDTSNEITLGDRELVQQLVKTDKIEADSTLATFARDENRKFSLDEDSRAALEKLLRQGETTSSSPPKDDPSTNGVSPTTSATQAGLAGVGFGGPSINPFTTVGAGSGDPTRQRVDVRNDITVNPSFDITGMREMQEFFNNPKRFIERKLNLPNGGR